MLEVIGALCFGVTCTADFAVLFGLAAIGRTAKIVAFVIAAAWLSLLVAIGAAGGFEAGALGPVPGPVIPFALLLVGGLLAWFASPTFRRAFLSVPLAGLIGINILRVVGVFFLILHARGQLAAPFAISAGWGDIITGVVAIPLTALAAWKRPVPGWLSRAWNVFGALDLVTAVTLGALSAPGTPFRVFTEAPGTAAMGTLPWVGIPALLVPVYLITHLAIGAKLRATETTEANTQAGINRQTTYATADKVA
jgi:hypothetical protein